MSQTQFIKDVARYALENDQDNLHRALAELINYFRTHNKMPLAMQLQALLRESVKFQSSPLVKVGSPHYIARQEEKETNDLIIQKFRSEYKLDQLVCNEAVRRNLEMFITEHRLISVLQEYDLPVSNKLILHGPSGCGKTLAAYVLAGELKKVMIVVNLGAIVSSRLGETSKNLAKIFRQAANESSVILIDEFDSVGKLRDSTQDHGEMKRVVNTLLQLFDYLPSDNVLVAATNHIEMIDDALLRRFDLQIELQKPDEEHIKEIIGKTLQGNKFSLEGPHVLSSITKLCEGLSYYEIQKTLITALKQSLLQERENGDKPKISTKLWKDLITIAKRQNAAVRKKRTR